MKLLLCAICCAAVAAAAPAGQDTFSERNPHYKLQPGDSLEIQYRYTPEYNSTPTIEPDGFVQLPLVGELKLGGLTLDEVTALVKQKASVRLNDPEVSVSLKDFVRPSFFVGGQVEHPGRFEMRGPITALQAIAMSGGFKESSKHSQVILVQKFNSEYARVTVLNMKKMLTPEGVKEDVTLQPGDMLIVPQNVVSKMERFVRWSSIGVYGLSMIH